MISALDRRGTYLVHACPYARIPLGRRCPSCYPCIGQRIDIVKTCDRQVTGYLTRGGVFLPPTPLSTAVQGDAAHAMASL